MSSQVTESEKDPVTATTATAASQLLSASDERSFSLAKQLFADCALVEIIHLHDCIRVSLQQIKNDVASLVALSLKLEQGGAHNQQCIKTAAASSSSAAAAAAATWVDPHNMDMIAPPPSSSSSSSTTTTPPPSSLAMEIHAASKLSGAVSSRFHLIWSVFQAHSHAEDEFIWPALKAKVQVQQSTITSTTTAKSHNYNSSSTSSSSSSSSPLYTTSNPPSLSKNVEVESSLVVTNDNNNYNNSNNKCSCEKLLEQQEYEEDHAKEEKMFQQIHDTIRKLHGSFRYYYDSIKQSQESDQANALYVMRRIIGMLHEQTDALTDHVAAHLIKEETQCLPMVQTHLSKAEISILVGNIMGKRSAQVMSQILKLAMLSLPPLERMDMMLHMKEAMSGTFFEAWLTLGGWSDSGLVDTTVSEIQGKIPRVTTSTSPTSSNSPGRNSYSVSPVIESSSELSLKRSAMSNLSLDSMDHRTKNKRKLSDSSDHRTTDKNYSTAMSRNIVGKRGRMIRPSRYFVRQHLQVELVWSSTDATAFGREPPTFVPQFSEAELTPTYRYSEEKGYLVFGCSHYARACKLRHPETGQLFTCRLCCQELRENSTSTQSAAAIALSNNIPAFDRYAVKEILCMRCGSLQPSGPRCVNPSCGYDSSPILSQPKESSSIPFAKYFCSICNLYDDETKTIYHCPFCNVCRIGKGLGIDFRHCMQCNACVALQEYDNHPCIPQRLQGHCPICRETLFESTSPLRGMGCGHVMHLTCFNMYVAKGSYGVIECPLCKRIEKTG